ncbi:MAG: HAD family hydrolase [bacterium]
MSRISHSQIFQEIFKDIKAVIFDMDGVLVYNTEFHKKALKQFCSSKGFHLTDEDMAEKIYGRTNREWLLNLFDKDLTDELVEEYAQEKELIYRELYKDSIEPAPGLIEFLDLLDSLNILRAIGTSAPPVNVEFTLEKANLRKYFSLVIDDTMIKNSKPDPEIYLKAAAELGFQPQECVVFEDSKSGILAALNAGARVVALTSTLPADEILALEADFVIDDFYCLVND